MSKRLRRALISFDVEEFDLPREHGGEISLTRGVEVSTEGLERILILLQRTGVRATFFTTGNFATVNPELVRRILAEGHEVACHGVDHFQPKQGDATESKRILEKVLGGEQRYTVAGYRQPRMFPIDYEELARAGYKYDSSVNPAFIPGRYNHLDTPRHPYKVGEITEVPTSVATGMRIPLFWLTLHLLPLKVYSRLSYMAIRKTGYFATYFHPWEFSSALMNFKEVPGYIKHNSGEKLILRLEKVIKDLEAHGCEFMTYREYVEGLPRGAAEEGRD